MQIPLCAINGRLHFLANLERDARNIRTIKKITGLKDANGDEFFDLDFALCAKRSSVSNRAGRMVKQTRKWLKNLFDNAEDNAAAKSRQNGDAEAGSKSSARCFREKRRIDSRRLRARKSPVRKFRFSNRTIDNR